MRMTVKRLLFIVVFLSGLALGAAKYSVDISIPEVDGLLEVKVDKVELETQSKTLTVYTTISKQWTDKLDDLILEDLSRYYLGFLRNKAAFRSLVIMTRNNSGSEYSSIRDFLPKLPPVPRKEGESKSTKSLVPEKGYGDIDGFLKGKTVYLSPGHGWYYSSNLGRWATQRGVTNGLVEDDSNAELVSYFLLPYFQNAGALVFSARETDRAQDMIIIDEADGEDHSDNGIYEEGGTWADTTSGEGYGRTEYPVEVGDNPLKNGVYRYAQTGTSSWARWTANFSENGYRHVYITYKTYTDRAEEAVYTVNHAGGSTNVTVNQRHHGSTWVDLGKFYFKKGLSKENGSVELNINDDSSIDSVVIADAVKFGGGMGALSRSNKTSEKPRWEEAAKVNIQFLGAPESVYQSAAADNSSDVTARSRWAAWENEVDFDDSIYLSWHSNGYNGNSRGLSTYIYSPNGPGEGYFPGSASEGSQSMGEKVHDRILTAVQALYDSDWDEVGYGMYSAYFGELNPTYNNEMPSCLVELAYHDNALDANMLKDPKFRDIAARAAYQGVVDYFADRDEVDPIYLPSPPKKIAAKVDSDGNAVVSWEAAATDVAFHTGHPATGFIVFMSKDGYGFDNGIDVGNVSQYTFTGLELGEKTFFRVVAYNSGGISFPSSVTGMIPQKSVSQILVVNGFERVDRFTSRFAPGDGASNRYMLEYINSFNYIVAYANVLEDLGFTMDCVDLDSFSNIDISGYDHIIWFSGEQSSGLGTFLTADQAKITQYLSDGGSMFISGSEIGWDLVEKGSLEDTTFFNEVLNVDYIKDSSDLYTFFGAGDFSGIDGTFDDGTYIYQANYPDVVEPFSDIGETFSFYDGAKTMGAGIITLDGKKVAFMGFPFETILDSDVKKDLMAKVVEKFELEPWEVPEEEPDVDDEDFLDEEDDEDSVDDEEDVDIVDDEDVVDEEDTDLEDDMDEKEDKDEGDIDFMDDVDVIEDKDEVNDSSESDSGCGCVVIKM